MAASMPQTIAGRPYADYLGATTRARLIEIVNEFGLVRGLSHLNKVKLLDAFKEHIEGLNPRPTGHRIYRAFGFAPSRPPRVPPAHPPPRARSSRLHPQGQPPPVPPQLPPASQAPPAPSQVPLPGQAPPVPPPAPPSGQAPGVDPALPPPRARPSRLRPLKQAPPAPPQVPPPGQAPGVGPALPPLQALPAGQPPPLTQQIELPVKRIEKPRSRPAEPNSTDIQEILRRVLKSLEQKDPELTPPYNHGLSIDPEADDPTYTAPSDGGLTVSDAQAFMTALQIAHPIGDGPEVSFVKMVSSGSPAKYRFADSNDTYPFRGRGPVWRNNSCAVDTCIVAGMFLNAGLTTADKGTETRTSWTTSLTPLQETFLDAINSDWKSISSEESIDLRDVFFDMYIRAINSTRSQRNTAPALKKGMFMPAVTVWELSTMNCHQFTFLTKRFLNVCKSCGTRTEPPKEDVPESSVAIEIKNNEHKQTPPPSFEHLLRNYFGYTPLRDCGKCKAIGTRFRRRLIVGDLPPRLVVEPHVEYRHMPGYASDEVSFDYEDPDGTVRHATYRWLGGIYLYNNHYRTYWNDSAVGDKRKLLRLYDGQHEGGIIIGGIEPKASDPENKDQRIIHEDWEDGTDLLFYERTDNPVVESLCAIVQKAADALDKQDGEGNHHPGGDGGDHQPGGIGGDQPGGDGGDQPEATVGD